MRKEQFKLNFIANFLSTYAALNYDVCFFNCSLYNTQIPFPVKDSDYLAEKAWDKIINKINIAELEDE